MSAKALAAADPTNAAWQRDLAVAYEKVRHVAVMARRLDKTKAGSKTTL